MPQRTSSRPSPRPRASRRTPTSLTSPDQPPVVLAERADAAERDRAVARPPPAPRGGSSTGRTTGPRVDPPDRREVHVERRRMVAERRVEQLRERLVVGARLDPADHDVVGEARRRLGARPDRAAASTATSGRRGRPLGRTPRRPARRGTYRRSSVVPGRGLEQPPGRDEPRPVPPAPVRQVDRQVVVARDDPADDRARPRPPRHPAPARAAGGPRTPRGTAG